MKRRAVQAAAVVLSIAMGLSLSGCGGNTNGDGKTSAKAGNNAPVTGKNDSEDKTIVFWNIGTEGADKKIYEYAITKFENEAGNSYKIDTQPTQNDKYKEKLVIAMSSGECPDAYTTWSGGPMNEYIKSGFAQPLDELYEKYGLKDRFMEGALEQVSFNGKIYGVPVKNISIAGIYYNKDLFDKYNVKVPSTVSELEKASDTFLANGIIPFALANGPKWTGSMYFQYLAARKGGLEPFRNACDGSGSFEDECFEYGGEKIQEWVKKGYFPDGFNSMSEDDGQAKQLFYTEAAAMYLTGSWNTAAIKTDSEEGGSDFYSKVGWFSFPAVDGSSADVSILCGTLGDQFISFNCTGEKLEEAFKFAVGLSDDDTVEQFVEAGMIPPLKGIEAKITDPLSKQIVEAANKASAVQLWYDQYLNPSVANAHLDGNQEVFGLTITPQEANKKMQEAQKEVLSGEK
jgi:raffinose/stachyose/melibiose transport system substrate-binding protein